MHFGEVTFARLITNNFVAVFSPIAGLESVKASCNWMWPAKVHEKVDGSFEPDADIQVSF